MKAEIEARIKAAANAAKPATKPAVSAAATRKKNAANAANATSAKRNNNAAATRKNNAANAKRNNNAAATRNKIAATMNVHVQNFGGRIETFNVKQDATVGELRRLANQLVEAPLERVKLTVESNSGYDTLDDDTRTLVSYGVIDNSTVYVVARAVDPGTLIRSYQLRFPAVRICGADDELFFTSSDTTEIDVLRISDKEQRTIGNRWLESTENDIKVMNDEIFVLDYDKKSWRFKTIHVFRKSDGEHQRQFDVRDISLRGKQMCISPNNEIFIRNRNDINVISALDGTLQRTIPNVFSDDTYNEAFCILNGELFSYTHGSFGTPLINVYNPNDGTLLRAFEMPNAHTCFSLIGEENTLFVVCDNKILVLRPSDGFLIHEIIEEIGNAITGACVLDNKLFVVLPGQRKIEVYQAGFDIPLSRRNTAKHAMVEAKFKKVNLNAIQQAPAMVRLGNVMKNFKTQRGKNYRTSPLPQESVRSVFANTLEGQSNTQQTRLYNNDQKAVSIEKKAEEALALSAGLLERINTKLALLERNTNEISRQTIGVLISSKDKLNIHRKEIVGALSRLTGITRLEKYTLKSIEEDINKAAIRIEAYSKALELTLKGGRRTQKKRRTSRK